MRATDLAGMVWTQALQLAALVAVVAIVTRFAVKSRPHLAHVLWLVVLAKCLTPPLVTSRAGIFCWLQPWREATTSTSVPSKNASRIMALSTAARYSAADDSIEGVEEGWPATSPTHDSVAIAPVSERGLSWSFIAILPWLGGLWLAGSAAFLARAVVRWRACLRRVARSPVESRPDLDALVAGLSRRLKLHRPVRLLVTSSRFGPAVVGLWRPTILLPAVIVNGKTASELEPILAHELIHVRRGDLWIGLWQVAAEAVWWFHPLVRVANRLATRAAEACCDEEVLAELKCDPDSYARSLLEVLQLQRGLRSVPVFPGMRPADVTRKRLERIMSLGHGCHPRTPIWCWLVLLLAAAVALPGAEFVVSANEDSGTPADGERPENPVADVARTANSGTASPTNGVDGISLEAGKNQPLDDQRIDMVIDLHHDVGTQKVDQAIYLCAGEIFDHGKVKRDGLQRDRVLNLQNDVRLWLQDGSAKAMSDMAEIVVSRAPDGLRTVRLKLSGHVRWSSPTLAASAGELAASLDGAFRGDASPPRFRRLWIHSQCQLEARDWSATADTCNVVLASVDDTDDDGQQAVHGPTRIELQGNAYLACKKTPDLDSSIVRAARIAFRPSRRELIIEGAGKQGSAEQNVHDSSAQQVNDSRKPSVEQLAAVHDELVTVNYSVADLVVPVRDARLTISEDGTPVFKHTGQEVSKEGAAPAADPQALAQFDDLIDLIETTIAPESWDRRHGPGSMMPYRTTLSLVIRQKQSVHEEISDLLRQLRRLQDLQVVLAVDVLTVAEAPFKTMAVDLDSLPGDKIAHLTESQVKRVRELATESDGEPVMRGPKLTLFNGQGLELALRRKLKRAGWVRLPAIQIVPVVAADRSAVRLRIAIGAKEAIDALARSRDYVIKQDQSLLADITDDLDSRRIPGLPRIPVEALVGDRKSTPSERVLLLITPRAIVQEEEEVKNERLPGK